MSRPVLDFDPRAAIRPEAGPAVDTRDAPGVFELVPRQFRVAEDELDTVQQNRLRDKYAPVVDALIERGYERNVLFDSLQADPVRELGGAGEYNRAVIWQFIKLERDKAKQAGKADPFATLPQDRKAFEKAELSRDGARYVDQAEIARAPQGTQIASGILGIGALEMTRPINIATLPIGGFGKNIATKILTEGLTQAGIGVIGLPEQVAGRQAMGEEYTAGEALLNITAAGVGGATLRGGFELAPGAAKIVGDTIIDPVRRALDPNAEAKAMAKAFEDMVPQHLRTPEQDAALFVLRRSAEVEDASPYVRTYEGIDAHVAKMEEAMRALEEGRIPKPENLTGAASPVPVPTSRPPGGGSAFGRGFNIEEVKRAIRGPESAGDDNAKNGMGSSATGRYQFIEETFVRVYQREFGVNEAAARRAWATSRNNVDVQERLMDRLVLDNAKALERAGITPDAGNLYLAHFAGAGKAIELARAPRDALVADFFWAKAIRQNPGYLGGEGKTVGEAIDIIRAKVGDPGQVSPSPIDPRLMEPELLDPALSAERPVVMLNDQPIGTSAFRASEIGVDAELMQFKSGGDQFGVTDRLRTVEEWDSYQAGFVTVWESLDGRRLIADGHQRHGLATRIGERTGQDIELNAYVLREADGITAADARRITALRNVAEGSGTKTDAAKVFRDLAPEEVETVLRRMAKGGEFIKDARGLARLDNEAFGAVINDVLPENYGAAIGQLVDDPALHMGMVKILAETQPANRRQAEAIIRQALDAGFVKETQDSLFGSEQLMTGLFAQRAKLLDRALSELKRLKGAFGVAVRNADTLEAGGNKIDVAGSAAEVDANARALAFVNALALRKGNAVNELLTRAAERIAAGEQPAAVLKQFVADVRKLDLDAIARETDDAGGRGAGDGAGSGASDVADEGGFFDDGPGFFGRDEPTPADLDAAAAAKPRSDHTDLPPDPDPRFAEPDGPGIAAAADSAWHDIRQVTDTDPAVAARQAQEAKLKAEAPMRARTEQDGEMGLGLFDAVDQKFLFDLGDGRGERSVADIRADIDADRAAIDTIRACLI